MSKQATYIEEQIQLMQERGMVITDTNKAKEILLDVGYYRLGFYTYPFELYPNVNPRSHQYKPGTDFNQIIELYYFDHDLRHVLLKYISRIEVNLRTFITYTCSNYYKSNPTWFVSPKAVTRKFRQEFEQKIYLTLRQNPCIAKHHKRYDNDKFAPAWKTMEFMTLGSIITLYENLLDKSLKLQIAQHYGLNTIALFENYLQTIKVIRNACAHGNHIFDLQLIKAVKKGPLANYDDKHRHNIYSVLLVVLYFLHIISENREEELRLTLKEHIQTYKNRDHVTILNDFLQNIL
jgi:abortive infection bacteriophage resistance protein